MQPLRVSQLPFVRMESNPHSVTNEQDGFVDEAVIHAMVHQPTHRRSLGRSSDMVLSAEDLDFAGWNFPTMAVERPSTTVLHSEPVKEEAPFSAPLKFSHHLAEPMPEGKSYWWIAGIAGIITAIVLSLILLKLIAPATFNLSPKAPQAIKAPVEASA